MNIDHVEADGDGVGKLFAGVQILFGQHVGSVQAARFPDADAARYIADIAVFKSGDIIPKKSVHFIDLLSGGAFCLRQILAGQTVLIQNVGAVDEDLAAVQIIGASVTGNRAGRAGTDDGNAEAAVGLCLCDQSCEELVQVFPGGAAGFL